MSVITLFTRQGCHLCREAEKVLRCVVTHPDVIEVVDIDTDPSLTDRYTVRVPVVELDGAEIAQYHVDETAVRNALQSRL